MPPQSKRAGFLEWSGVCRPPDPDPVGNLHAPRRIWARHTPCSPVRPPSPPAPCCCCWARGLLVHTRALARPSPSPGHGPRPARRAPRHLCPPKRRRLIHSCSALQLGPDAPRLPAHPPWTHPAPRTCGPADPAGRCHGRGSLHAPGERAWDASLSRRPPRLPPLAWGPGALGQRPVNRLPRREGSAGADVQGRGGRGAAREEGMRRAHLGSRDRLLDVLATIPVGHPVSCTLVPTRRCPGRRCSAAEHARQWSAEGGPAPALSSMLPNANTNGSLTGPGVVPLSLGRVLGLASSLGGSAATAGAARLSFHLGTTHKFQTPPVVICCLSAGWGLRGSWVHRGSRGRNGGRACRSGRGRSFCRRCRRQVRRHTVTVVRRRVVVAVRCGGSISSSGEAFAYCPTARGG